MALGAVQALSIAWSPTPLLGIRYLFYFLPLPLAAHALYRLTRERPAFARGCLKALLLGSALEAVLVIAFRLSPSLELAFLRQRFAELFISANTLDALFHESRNNVLDPAKAGGLFVNANVASAYLGMGAVAAWYLGRVMRSTALRAVALLDWGAVALTGSKAGLLCAVVVPLGLAFMSAVRARRANPVTLFVATLALGLGAVALSLPLSQELLDDYRANTLATIGSRQEIWHYALKMIGEHPAARSRLRGLGEALRGAGIPERRPNGARAQLAVHLVAAKRAAGSPLRVRGRRRDLRGGGPCARCGGPRRACAGDGRARCVLLVLHPGSR